MVRLSQLTEEDRTFLLNYECPKFEIEAFVSGPPLTQRRVALMTSAGLRCTADPPFSVDAVDYRIIPSTERYHLVMDHISAGHDRTGFAQDLNTVLPIDRLQELAEEQLIGSVAELHYSFMGAGDVYRMESPARQIAHALKRDGVDAVVLSPV